MPPASALPALARHRLHRRPAIQAAQSGTQTSRPCKSAREDLVANDSRCRDVAGRGLQSELCAAAMVGPDLCRHPYVDVELECFGEDARRHARDYVLTDDRQPLRVRLRCRGGAVSRRRKRGSRSNHDGGAQIRLAHLFNVVGRALQDTLAMPQAKVAGPELPAGDMSLTGAAGSVSVPRRTRCAPIYGFAIVTDRQ